MPPAWGGGGKGVAGGSRRKGQSVARHPSSAAETALYWTCSFRRAFLVISILTECLPHTWPELLQPEAQQQASTDNFPLLSQSHRLELPRLDLSSYCPMPFLVGQQLSPFHVKQVL